MASTGAASTVAPNSITSHNSRTNGRTVAKRSTTCARHCPCASAAGGGVISCTPATAAASRARDPTAVSMASHTRSSGTASPQLSASNSTCTALASTATCLDCPGSRRSFCLSACLPARPISSGFVRETWVLAHIP